MQNNTHFVSVPQDLNLIKSKFMFGLTKRQVICFAIGAVVGAPIFFIAKAFTDNLTVSITLMFIFASPAIVCGLFERNGLFINDYAKLMIDFFRKPKIRTYQSENTFKLIERDIEYERLLKKLKRSYKR